MDMLQMALSRREYNRTFSSLVLDTGLLLIQPKIVFTILAAKSCCKFILTLQSTLTAKSFHMNCC